MAWTLLLDLDGTLVDTVPDLAAALNRLMHRHGLAPFTHAETAALVGDGVAVLVRRALAARGAAPGEAAIHGAIAGFAADYGAHAAVESRLFPGIADLLRDLEAEGWRLAICTNKPESAARSLLDALGLSPLLRAVGGGDSFPVRKPDPAHLLATLALAEDALVEGGSAGAAPTVGAARAIMVGDHANDVAAARGAGVRSVFVTWGYGPPAMAEGADAVAHDPAELLAVLRRFRDG